MARSSSKAPVEGTVTCSGACLVQLQTRCFSVAAHLYILLRHAMPRERFERPRQQQPRDQLVEAGHHNGEAVALVADGAAHVLPHCRARRRQQSPPLRRRAAAPEGRSDRGARCRHTRIEVRQQGSWTETGPTAAAADLAPSCAVHKLFATAATACVVERRKPSWIVKISASDSRSQMACRASPGRT